MLLCSKFPHTFHTQYKEFFHKYAARFVSVVLLRDRFQYTDHSQYIYFPYNSVYFSFSMSPGCDTICIANYIPVKIQLSVFPVRHAEKSSVSDLPVIFCFILPLTSVYAELPHSAFPQSMYGNMHCIHTLLLQYFYVFPDFSVPLKVHSC